MLVDVVLMRREGVKLPPAALRAATPVRGILRVQTRPNLSVYPNQPPTVTTATLTDVAGRHLVPAEQREQRGGQFVVVGREAYGSPGAHTTRPQAWWCRVVDVQAATSAPAPAPGARP